MNNIVPDQHLTYMGDIIVLFALLEMGIQSLIGSLIYEHQRVGQIITAELSFRNLRALAISLYLERHGKDGDYSKLKPLMNEAGEIEETRNNIVHSIWGVGKDKDHITRIKATAKEKRGLDFQFVETSVNDLAEFANKIRKCHLEIASFHHELIRDKKAISSPIEKFW